MSGFSAKPLRRAHVRGRGFTLIELLVALFIAATMFAMGYGALNQALADRASLEASQSRLSEVQNTMRLFVQDFSQAAPRPARSPVGDNADAAMLANPRDPAALVTLTRFGWTNPAGLLQRPTLQRVRYVLEDETLYREHWRVLDATLGAKPVRRKVIEGVTGLRLRYMDQGRSWQEEWPGVIKSGPPGTHGLRNLPIAVEITLELEDYGVLTRLVEIAG